MLLKSVQIGVRQKRDQNWGHVHCSVKTPALDSKDDEVVARGQDVVAERDAGVGAAVVEVTVEPDAEVAVASANGESVVLTADEQRVFAGPFEYAEVVATWLRFFWFDGGQRIVWFCSFHILKNTEVIFKPF